MHNIAHLILTLLTVIENSNDCLRQGQSRIYKLLIERNWKNRFQIYFSNDLFLNKNEYDITSAVSAAFS